MNKQLRGIFMSALLIKQLHTFIASMSSLTGSCSCAHGFLKCWRDSMRDLTINPYNITTSQLTVCFKQKIQMKKAFITKSLVNWIYTAFQFAILFFFFNSVEQRILWSAFSLVSYLWINKPYLLSTLFNWSFCLQQFYKRLGNGNWSI